MTYSITFGGEKYYTLKTTDGVGISDEEFAKLSQ